MTKHFSDDEKENIDLELGIVPEDQIDPQEIMASVSLKMDDEEPPIAIAKPIVKQQKNGEDDEKVAKELYDEFSTFLEDKADMKPELELKKTIPVGIDVLDAVLGGGFAIGALSIIVGQPGSGKSMLAMQALAQGQREYNGQLVGGYLDSEEATTTIRLSNLGVRYPQLKPYTDITVEKVFKFLEGLCLFKEKKKIIETPSIVVWDSIANTLSEKEREAEDVNQVIGYKARMLSILIPKYVAKCGQHNVSLIAVNQLRDVIKIGHFASNFWTNYNFLINTKRLSSGAWNYLVSMPDKKFRTKDAEKLYYKDVEFKEKYDEAVKEAIQTEIIDKYNPDID